MHYLVVDCAAFAARLRESAETVIINRRKLCCYNGVPVEVRGALEHTDCSQLEL